MKKIIPFLFITILFLNACTASEATSTAEGAATHAATKTPRPESTAQAVSNIKVPREALNGLQITVLTPWYDVEAGLFDTLVKEFNGSNEWGIQVQAQHQVNFTNLYDMTTSSLPSPQRPDFVIALPEHALEWNENRLVTDLTPYAQDPVYGMDSSDIPFVFWNQDDHAGVRVAVPAQRTARFLLWNETWAGELGFDASPDAPQDFKQQACRAQQSMLKDDQPQNDSSGGWYVDTEPMTAYAWLLAFEGGVLEGNGYHFLTPNNIESFKYLRELAEEACSWQSPVVDAATAFASRQALLITASLQDLPEVARAFAVAKSRDDWKVIAFPGANDDALVVYGSSYVVLNSIPEKQLASWLFIRWLLENEQDARFVEATHLFPLRTSTLELLGDYQKSHPQWAQAINLLPQGELQPQLASWRKVKVMLGDGFTQMYRVNVSSGQVAAILAQMESLSRDISE
jgi:multiple sugar transport system substrate-binding protein